jgi:hypothetical protein
VDIINPYILRLPVLLKSAIVTARSIVIQNGINNGIEFKECPFGKIDNYDGLWYWGIVGERKIDLLIIDGAPAKTHQLARYPALPVLHECLSRVCVVILDDHSRDD